MAAVGPRACPGTYVVWGLITYSAFYTEEGRSEVGLVGWLLVSAMIVLIGVMIWLMSSGKLPAYIIEAPDDERKQG